MKQLAERRTDIFGVGDEETVIGKKLGEEETKKDERVTWDGHTSSVALVAAAARANITLEDQIHQIHKVCSPNTHLHLLQLDNETFLIFKVKGLIPDEDLEKIGPKPAGGVSIVPTTSKPTLQPIVMSQAQIIVPPKPPQMVHTQMPQHHQPPPVMMMQMRPPPMMRKLNFNSKNFSINF